MFLHVSTDTKSVKIDQQFPNKRLNYNRKQSDTFLWLTVYSLYDTVPEPFQLNVYKYSQNRLMRLIIIVKIFLVSKILT